MQTVSILGQPLATSDIQVLQGIADDLSTAPAEEFVAPGVSATTMVHVPEDEGEPWGKYAVEWSNADVAAYSAARGKVIAAITQAVGQPAPEVKRMLVTADAFPPEGITMIEVPRLRRQLKNLIAVYNAKVLGNGQTRGGVVLAGGIFLAAALLGIFSYAKWKEGR